jgi:hypothetical protein
LPMLPVPQCTTFKAMFRSRNFAALSFAAIPRLVNRAGAAQA